jgi:hypothetical protein
MDSPTERPGQSSFPMLEGSPLQLCVLHKTLENAS